MRGLCVLGALGLMLAVGGTAYATTVQYTVSGWGPQQFPGPYGDQPTESSPWGPDGYPGDTVELQTYTGSLDLPSGPVGTHTQVIQKINTLLWTVDYTYGGTDGWDPWPDILQTFTVVRDITIDGAPADALSQSGDLLNSWSYDYLGLSAGSQVTLYIDNTYKIDVTPLGLSQVKMNNWSGDAPWEQNPRDVMAQFDITVIPEPLTMLGVFAGVAGLGGYIRKRRMA